MLQFLLYNSDTVGSLNPTANNHIQTTSFTLQVRMRLHGLAPEHVLRGGGDNQLPGADAQPHEDPFFDLAAVQQALARLRLRVGVRLKGSGEPSHEPSPSPSPSPLP